MPAPHAPQRARSKDDRRDHENDGEIEHGYFLAYRFNDRGPTSAP